MVAESLILTAFLLGLVSAVSLPLGTISSAFWRPSDRAIAFLMAFGGGALLAALTIDLVASAVEVGQFTSLGIGCILGGLLFVLLNELVNDYGGFVRKASTTFYYLRKEKHRGSIAILKNLRKPGIFEGLTIKEYRALAASMVRRHFKQGELIYHEGDPAEALYMISSGEVELLNPRQDMAPSEKLGKYESFGWLEILSGAPSATAAVAVSDVTLWILPRGALFSLVPNSPTLIQQVHRELRSEALLNLLQDRHAMSATEIKTWSDKSVKALLNRGVFSEAVTLERKDDEFLEISDDIKRFDLFAHLTQDELQEIATHLIYKRFPKGQTLFHKGDISNRMYFIARGEVSLINPSLHLRATETLGPATAFGGYAFLSGSRHALSALTTEDTEVWVLRKSDFDELLAETPVLTTKLKQYINDKTVSEYLQYKQHIDTDLIDRWKRKAQNAIDSSTPLPAICEMSFELTAHRGAPLAIWLGILLDGIPESLVIGASLVQAHISYSLIGGLFLSNYPEALSSSVGMRQHGYPFRRILLMWTSLMVVTGIGAAIGNVFFTGAPPPLFALVEGIAAGAMLTMIAQTMLPEAYLKGGTIIGFSTLLGFLAAIFLKTLE
ncbi:MAG: cyclic nucleotide-binding domain-containing protein [Pseudomonadota bacterium]|nr:cyclic nucleotide-binding domain-containing protein [Pseudomonadota bacterium]